VTIGDDLCETVGHTPSRVLGCNEVRKLQYVVKMSTRNGRPLISLLVSGMKNNWFKKKNLGRDIDNPHWNFS